MDIHEQAFLSGLVFTHDQDKIEPQWRPQTRPPSERGCRSYHASVVVKYPDTTRDENVVITGGYTRGFMSETKWTIVFNVGSGEWQHGPCMQEYRYRHASVVCNGAIYAIGGRGDFISNDSIERINIRDLLGPSSSSNETDGWTMLTCRLTTGREGCAAAVVRDRFIVVAGGWNGSDTVSSVDIIDTLSGNPCSVIAGPLLKVARSMFGMGVVGECLYVVGGKVGTEFDTEDRVTKSVEYLEFDGLLDNTASSATTVFPFSKSWTVHSDLSLNTPRKLHAVVQVGSCLVVAGGLTNGNDPLRSVEVLDTLKSIVWKLPQLRHGRSEKGRDGCSMVYLSRGATLIDPCDPLDLWQTLSLGDKNSWLFARLLASVKVPI